tara:strand:+ start:11543 stop:11851 length:309 start_codon:yes stop_codon:yes gene_type:complete
MAITASVSRGFTYATGVDISAANLNELGVPTVTINESNVNITGGSLSGVLITLPSYAVSALPSAGTAGRVVFCTDGDGGNKCLAVDDGSNWKRVALGATVST